MPGDEIIGRVTRAGAGVTELKAGHIGAVGCMVDSCRACERGQAQLAIVRER